MKPTITIDAHQIATGLWIGSHPKAPVGHLFDTVVLCALERQGKLPGVHNVKAPLDDATPSKREIRVAVSAAKTIHELRRRGKKVLVTCAQGVNRSSLVAAMAMMLDGESAQMAIHRIRSRRFPPIGMKPLSNESFVQLLYRLDQQRPNRGHYRAVSTL